MNDNRCRMFPDRYQMKKHVVLCHSAQHYSHNRFFCINFKPISLGKSRCQSSHHPFFPFTVCTVFVCLFCLGGKGGIIPHLFIIVCFAWGERGDNTSSPMTFQCSYSPAFPHNLITHTATLGFILSLSLLGGVKWCLF